ncbi:MAG: AAA family ATPase [Nitrososphaerales archaeon]
MQEIVLTEEQREIVKRVFENRVVLVNAFAGTGKTTTCMATIKEANKRGKKALYLVFNRAMSKSAKEKGNLLGLDADIKTVHSLAYGELAKRGYFKGKQVGSIKTKMVADAFGIPTKTAFWLLEFFNQFLFSSYPFDKIDAFIEEKVKINRRFAYGLQVMGGSYDVVSLLYDLVDKVRKGELITPHDFYLKDFVFSEHVIRLPHKLVILDESQDANPLFMELMQRIKAEHLLIVGDKHQRIYQFRNTVDAFRFFTEPLVLYLTQTFRFGSNISDLANTILAFKGEKKRIRPMTSPKGVEKEQAVLSYTNSQILSYYLDLTEKEREVATFEKDIEEVIKPVLSILVLKEANDEDLDDWDDWDDWDLDDKAKVNRVIARHSIGKDLLDFSILNTFKNYEEVQYYVEQISSAQKTAGDEDSNLLTDMEIVQAYRLSEELTISELLMIIEEYRNNKAKRKNLYLSTAHASKGMEYAKVILLPDLAIEKDTLLYFLEQQANNGHIPADIIMSMNLLYVAITRASTDIEMHPDVVKSLKFMEKHIEKQQPLKTGETGE